jgi:hypothetical protein
MANTNAPNGFRWVGRVDGSPPNVGLAQRQIAYDNTTKIFWGDPVVSLGTGYVAQAAAGTTQIAGVFYGCQYLSASQNRLTHSPYWPGADAVQGSITCLICTDPLAVFLVQATAGPLTIADIDANVQFTLGAGNTLTGFSTATVDTPAVTATLPFRITGLSTTLANGGDATTAYNQVFVTFNNVDFKSLTGIV